MEKRLKISITILLLSLFITLAFFLPYLNNNYFILVAKDDSIQKILCTKLVKKGDEFVLNFRNSISKTFAEEVFTILAADKIELNEFRYQSGDAGFPFGYEGDFSLENNFMIIKNLNKFFQKIDNVRIAATYPHYLIVGNNYKYNLTENAAGHVLSITIKKISNLLGQFLNANFID